MCEYTRIREGVLSKGALLICDPDRLNVGTCEDMLARMFACVRAFPSRNLLIRCRRGDVVTCKKDVAGDAWNIYIHSV